MPQTIGFISPPFYTAFEDGVVLKSPKGLRQIFVAGDTPGAHGLDTVGGLHGHARIGL
jgi:hypothetical protein